jgi:hypothetical protein
MSLMDLTLQEYHYLIRLLMTTNIRSEYIARRSLKENGYMKGKWDVPVNVWTEDDKRAVDLLEDNKPIQSTRPVEDLFAFCCQQLRVPHEIQDQLKPLLIQQG